MDQNVVVGTVKDRKIKDRKIVNAKIDAKDDESTELLNMLHQELKHINAGLIRTNIALIEFVAEVKLMRKSKQEDITI